MTGVPLWPCLSAGVPVKIICLKHTALPSRLLPVYRTNNFSKYSFFSSLLMFIATICRCLLSMSQRPFSPPPSFFSPVSFNLSQLDVTNARKGTFDILYVLQSPWRMSWNFSHASTAHHIPLRKLRAVKSHQKGNPPRRWRSGRGRNLQMAALRCLWPCHLNARVVPP